MKQIIIYFFITKTTFNIYSFCITGKKYDYNVHPNYFQKLGEAAAVTKWILKAQRRPSDAIELN